MPPPGDAVGEGIVVSCTPGEGRGGGVGQNHIPGEGREWEGRGGGEGDVSGEESFRRASRL